MSLKCSVFGHSYGDTEVRRNREQQGSELVETVKEVKVCDRCGEFLIISETTEVTTVKTTDETGQTAPGPGTTDDGGVSTAGQAGGTPHGTDTTGPPGGETKRRDSGRSPERSVPDSNPRNGGGMSADPRTGDSHRVDTTATDTSDASDPITDDPGTSTDQELSTPRKDDAIIIDDDDEEHPGSEWPQDEDTATDSKSDDWEPDTEPETDTDSRMERSSGSGSGLTVPEGEFHCPECGFSTTVESSSLREGDFCPECHRGALEHHS